MRAMGQNGSPSRLLEGNIWARMEDRDLRNGQWREQEIVEEEEEDGVMGNAKAKVKVPERKESADYQNDEEWPPTRLWYGQRSYPLPANVARQREKARKNKWDEDDEVSESSQLFGILRVVAISAGVCLIVGLSICAFLLYLSFAPVQRPSLCDEKVILNFTAQRIRLKGGRYVSFREQGVSADRARRSLLVVHGLFSSRLAGIPGISDSVLTELGVRLVAYDRPGYGQSDPQPGRNYTTSAMDMVDIADALGMGDKFWIIGYGIGGPHVWAAIKHIPERLAGAAMFAPAGNPFLNNLTKEEVNEIWRGWSLRQKWMLTVAHFFPAILSTLLQKTVGSNSNYLRTFLWATSLAKDKALMEQENFSFAWEEDTKEALRQGCMFPVAEELILLVTEWGFSLSDLPFKIQESKSFLQQVLGLFGGKEQPRLFSGPIHIWQGSDDQVVPMPINILAKKLTDNNVFSRRQLSPIQLHLLKGEGHYSWFWFCHDCHHKFLETLFTDEEEEAIVHADSEEVTRDKTALVAVDSQQSIYSRHESDSTSEAWESVDNRADLCTIICYK